MAQDNDNRNVASLCDQNPKQEFETSWDQSSTAKMAPDNDNQKGGDKPKRRGNHNQGDNENNFRGCTSKQNKVVLTLDPAPKPTKTTSVNIIDEMGNEAKEKLPNNRDDDNGALLDKICQKVIAVCETYKWVLFFLSGSPPIQNKSPNQILVGPMIGPQLGPLKV